MTKRNDYEARFERLFEYIDQHLDGDLSVERLSGVACFSKFHFHRLFTAHCGISIGRYLQAARLKRASFRLAFYPEQKIIDIALDAGFDTPDAFSRAFRTVFGQSPSAFRKAPQWQNWHERYRLAPHRSLQAMNVSIIDFSAIRVATYPHRGPIEGVNDSIRIFIDWRKTSGLSPKDSARTFGLMYDNPETTAPADFRFDICGEVEADVPPNPQGVVAGRIPAGRCAVVRHHGSHDRVGDTVRRLYRDWLPASGEEPRDFPLYFHYLNFVGETPEHELLTDVFLPLK